MSEITKKKKLIQKIFANKDCKLYKESPNYNYVKYLMSLTTPQQFSL